MKNKKRIEPSKPTATVPVRRVQGSEIVPRAHGNVIPRSQPPQPDCADVVDQTFHQVQSDVQSDAPSQHIHLHLHEAPSYEVSIQSRYQHTTTYSGGSSVLASPGHAASGGTIARIVVLCVCVVLWSIALLGVGLAVYVFVL